MKILIVWYSFYGTNALLATELGRRLSARLVPVRVRHVLPRTSVTLALDFFLKRQPRIHPVEADPRDFDHVLFVAPLYDMRVAQPMRAAVLQLRERLGPYSFVTFCGYRREGQAKHVRDELAMLVGRPPENVWELRVQDLVPPGDREKIHVVGRYRVKQAELRHYAAQIDAIVQSFRQGEAVMPGAEGVKH